MSQRIQQYALITCLALFSPLTGAAEEAGRATIVLLGEIDRFDIGQDGYCGERSEIQPATDARFRIPADKPTHFHLRSRYWTPAFHYTCEGDYSFLPEAGRLHLIRYALVGNKCQLQMFRGDPGAQPEPMPFNVEAGRSCLVR